MLTSGDVVTIDLGMPVGSEAGLERPAVVITAEAVLRRAPNVVQVVPLTRTVRDHATEVLIEADVENGLTGTSAAQCQHIRAISVARIKNRRGSVGVGVLAQVRETVALLLDL